jgi:glycosyltransferase involved in cell wall biosynthesis
MKILQVHNYYQLSGGEDTVVANEKALLEAHGHEVIPFYKRNEEINDYSFFEKAKLLKNTTWSKETYAEALQLLKEIQPDVCHVHNFLPLISPSIYQACKDAGVPVVQTLHNYRLICTNGLFLREGKVCEDCLGKSAYSAVRKKCYRDSAIQTYAVARMIEKNKSRKVWSELVDAYFCFTEFAKDKFVAHGLPAEKLFVKPNFVNPPTPESTLKKEDYFIYVGRLESNKGVLMLKEISRQLKMPIKVVGEGELKNELEGVSNIELLGKRPHSETLELIRNARALLFPSLCYEGMPMTILEAFAHKTLVIASDLGAMQSIIRHGQNGLLFAPGDHEELLKQIAMTSDQVKVQSMIDTAYSDFETLYSGEANYGMLMERYEALLYQFYNKLL